MKKIITLLLSAMLVIIQSNAQTPTLTIDPTNVTTLAGNGTPGYADGIGTGATMYSPYGVTADASGTVYATTNHVQFGNPNQNFNGLRRITAPGAVVTTLAGGSGGSDYITPGDGSGASAVFVGPLDIETDAAGNIYVLDRNYGITDGGVYVRLVTPLGQVSTIWSSSTSSISTYDFGAIAVSPDGTVYLSYSNGGSQVGIWNATTNSLAFDGSAYVGSPTSFAISRFTVYQGGFLVANGPGNKIQQVSEASVTTFAGTGVNADNGDGGLAIDAAMPNPQDVNVDALGNVYVLGNNRLRKISPAGYITTVAGNNDFPNAGFADGNGITAKFNQPFEVKSNATGTILYVADFVNQRIRKLAAPVLTPFSTITDNESASQYYSVSGAYLTADATITAPTGYEVSLSENSGYASNLTFTPQNSDVPSSNIYVRLAAATAPGTYNGNVVFSSAGAASVSMAVSGIVDPHQPGGAFNFNAGGYAWIPTNNFPVGNSDYTIECWVKSSEDRDNSIVIWGSRANNNANGLALLQGNKITNYWWFNDLVVDAPTVNNGAWHHIAATYDGTTRKIYMDGVLLGSDAPTGHDASSGTTAYLGVLDNYYNWLLKGTIDELRIFSKALTQGEIMAKKDCELPTGTADLALYYKFNQGIAFENNTAITGFADASGNGNNTTFFGGFTLNGPVSNFVTGVVANGSSCMPLISIADKSITEGNSGTTEMKFKVILSYSSANTVTVKYETADSTANAGSDYVAATKTLKIKPGKTSAIIKVLINGDTQIEPAEKIKVLLTVPVNATIADNLGVGTIKNDDVVAFAANANANEVSAENAGHVIVLKVSPNPAKDQVTISGLSAGKANYIELTDLSGRSLLKQKVTANAETIQMAKYASGVYFLRYYDGNKWQQVKVVKE